MCRRAVRDGHQSSRICASVLGSTFFSDNVETIPFRHQTSNQCITKEIAFQTEGAIKKSVSLKYQEWMLICEAVKIDSKDKTYYFVSRAYRSNQVFISNSDALDGRVYLVNLSTHIGIRDTSKHVN